MLEMVQLLAETNFSLLVFSAENVAEKYQITKQMQDELPPLQNKAEAAQKSGRFKDEIVPVTIKDRKGDKIVDTDEFRATASPSISSPRFPRPSRRMAR